MMADARHICAQCGGEVGENVAAEWCDGNLFHLSCMDEHIEKHHRSDALLERMGVVPVRREQARSGDPRGL